MGGTPNEIFVLVLSVIHLANIYIITISYWDLHEAESGLDLFQG